VNRKRPLLTTGGKQAMLGVKVLERCLDVLQNLEILLEEARVRGCRTRASFHDDLRSGGMREMLAANDFFPSSKPYIRVRKTGRTSLTQNELTTLRTYLIED
jgi:hypothetical protein